MALALASSASRGAIWRLLRPALRLFNAQWRITILALSARLLWRLRTATELPAECSPRCPAGSATRIAPRTRAVRAVLCGALSGWPTARAGFPSSGSRAAAADWCRSTRNRRCAAEAAAHLFDSRRRARRVACGRDAKTQFVDRDALFWRSATAFAMIKTCALQASRWRQRQRSPAAPSAADAKRIGFVTPEACPVEGFGKFDRDRVDPKRRAGHVAIDIDTATRRGVPETDPSCKPNGRQHDSAASFLRTRSSRGAAGRGRALTNKAACNPSRPVS